MINPDKIKDFFNPFRETSIAPLIVFRIIFGALMFFGVVRFMYYGWVDTLYIQPKFFFGYLGFEWVKPLEGNLMYIPFVLMLLSSLFIIVGLFYRYSAFIFFLCFTYVELLDKSNYLNHYYFVSLMSFLMILVPANGYFSFDSVLFPNRRRLTIPQWNTGILKFQLAVVYIFAGIAKVNTDWLFDANPLKIWLQAHHHIPFFGSFLKQEWLAYAFSWMGCFYDLFIVFFLLSQKYRPYAYFFVIFFHFVTWYLFPIGVFPWVMIFSTLIFFSATFHERILNFITSLFGKSKTVFASYQNFEPKKYIRVLLFVYIFVQIIIPFRYLMYKGDLFWNEEGFRFSWRVMLMHKEGHATFFMVDKKTNRELEIVNRSFLTPIQIDQMMTQPDMILQYAEIIDNYYDGKTLVFGGHKFEIRNPEIRAEIFVSLNGRPSQLFVSKRHDLSKLPYNLMHRNWLEPYKP